MDIRQKEVLNTKIALIYLSSEESKIESIKSEIESMKNNGKVCIYLFKKDVSIEYRIKELVINQL